MIKVEDLKKDYINGEVITRVLKGISFEIKDGDFVAIMGPSGSGKSTLMHILGFLDTPTSGKYFYKDKDVSNLDDEELARMRNEEVGFVFQAYNLLPKTSVFDNVSLPLAYTQSIDEKEKKDRVHKAIEAVGLKHRSDHLSNQLSGGEKQRVAIARALVNNPSVLFADEPTGNLDSRVGQQILKILQKLNSEGNTIIVVTHELDTAKHAKRIITIKDGLIIGDRRLNGGERKDANHEELIK